MNTAVSRHPLDAATEMTVAWLQAHQGNAPTIEMASEFFREMYQAAWDATYPDSPRSKQSKKEYQR